MISANTLKRMISREAEQLIQFPHGIKITLDPRGYQVFLFILAPLAKNIPGTVYQTQQARHLFEDYAISQKEIRTFIAETVRKYKNRELERPWGVGHWTTF